MALRKFTIEVPVNELYEMTVKIPFQNWDQREGSFTDYKTETKYFIDFNSACKWVSENHKSEVLEFVKILNKMEELKNWTKQ